MADAPAGQPPDPTFNPYNPWGTLAAHVGWAVDRALEPSSKGKSATPPPATGKPPGYAKGVSKVSQTRMGMLKRK
jgi:hypothetical protein